MQHSVRRKQPVKVKNVARAVKKIQKRQELKYSDRYFHTTAYTPTGGALSSVITGISVGTGNHERIGNQITLTSLKFQYNLYGQYNVQWRPMDIRILLVWDKEPHGNAANLVTSTPDPMAVLDNTTYTGMDTIYAPYNMNAGGRYKILHDRVYYMDSFFIDNTSTVRWLRPPSGGKVPYGTFKGKIRLNKKVQYSGTTANIADIMKGGLYLWCVTNDPSAYTYVTYIDCSTRLYFKDD